MFVRPHVESASFGGGGRVGRGMKEEKREEEEKRRGRKKKGGEREEGQSALKLPDLSNPSNSLIHVWPAGSDYQGHGAPPSRYRHSCDSHCVSIAGLVFWQNSQSAHTTSRSSRRQPRTSPRRYRRAPARLAAHRASSDQRGLPQEVPLPRKN